MVTISYPFLSRCFITLGAIVALWGILTVAPTSVINSSCIWSDQPGVIRVLFHHSAITDFVHQRNKAVLSLVLLSLGFVLAIPSFSGRSVSVFALMAVVVLIVLLIIAIAGRTRRDVITSWKSKECTVNWFIQLLDDSYFEARHKQWAATGQGDEHLTDVLVYFNHVGKALDIDFDFEVASPSKPSKEEIKAIQQKLRQDIDDTSLLYYLMHPIRLLRSYS